MKTGLEQVLEIQNKDMVEELEQLNRAIARLDEAMATPERIEEDIRLVGGFASSIDLTETAEDIVERAIQRFNDLKE